MSVIVVDTSSDLPPYEQVRVQIAAQVSNGDLPAGAKLPTVRQLAADLGLATNTVARAYRELESDGVVATHGRRGTFVRSDAMEAEDPATPARLAAKAYVAAVRRLGLSGPEATRLVEAAWLDH